jgi:hypothetical protein
MGFIHLRLVVVVREPADHLLMRHGEHLVSELAELFRERINGEEVGALATVR